MKVIFGRCSRSFGRRAFSSMASSTPALKPFNLALIQLGQVGSDKTKNIAHARAQVLKAASREDGPKPQLIVLPVSVTISGVFGQDIEIYWWTTAGMFQFALWRYPLPRVCGNNWAQARRAVRPHYKRERHRQNALSCCQGDWYLAARGYVRPPLTVQRIHIRGTGSIPEREASTGNLYNTSTVYSPSGPCVPILLFGRCR